MDVYVAPYRRPEARVRVSPAGGGQPTWRGDGKELFYISANSHLMSVAVGPAASGRALATESVPQVGPPMSLFEVAPEPPELTTYAPAPDGQRFLVMRPVDSAEVEHLEVIANWHPRSKTFLRVCGECSPARSPHPPSSDGAGPAGRGVAGSAGDQRACSLRRLCA